MTIVSLTDCCHLLAIDAKTLRRWLSLSGLSALPHPTDARCKCLTREQVQQLAVTHHRSLPSPLDAPFCSSVSTLSTSTMPVWPDFSALIDSLTKQLGSLHAHVAMLQHQLTSLSEPLKKELQWPTGVAETAEEKSLDSSQEKSLDSSQEKSLDSSQEKSLDSSQEKSLDSSQEKSLDSSQEKSPRPPRKNAGTGEVPDRRSRHQVLPLVEYSTDARYVVICPERGLLTIEPDSAEWFAWLSTLSSFHFAGASGHLTVRRNECSPRWTWQATRSIRSRSRCLHLVRTEFLTIAVLEQAAASLQSLLN